MTVDELLTKLAMAFPSFNATAVEAWAPVFRARFGHREGPKLADAYEQTLGEFSVKKSKSLFPVPADFEAFMPSLKDVKAPPIGKMLEERHQRARKLFEQWHDSQGLKIKEARPKAVYGACALEAYERGKRSFSDNERVLLSSEDIAICEQRAVTSERIHRFGAMPKSPEAWKSQCAEIRAEWASGEA